MDAARPIIRQALEGGINFFDTANVYSDGSSEEIVGRALAEHSKREDVYKRQAAAGHAPRSMSASSAHIRSSPASKIRLGTL